MTIERISERSVIVHGVARDVAVCNHGRNLTGQIGQLVLTQIERSGIRTERVVTKTMRFKNRTQLVIANSPSIAAPIDDITLPDDKQLVVEINEQNGGRHQQFTVTNAELVRARVINELKVK